MKATWVADGDATNNSLSVSDATDAIFGTVNTSAVVNVYGSGTSGAYFYPDQISPYGGGKSVFQYSATKIAGVRSNGGIFKTVYLGPGLEMLADTNVSKMIIKLSHDWFHGIISSAEFDKALQQAILGQNFPNPAKNSTSILLSGITSNMTLQLIDMTGRIVFTQAISKGTTSVEINTSSINEGIYLYRLFEDNKQIGSKLLQVIH